MTRRRLLTTFALLLAFVPWCRSADTQPPWVSISSPETETTISNMIFVSVTATDNVGVASVSLKMDGADIRAPLTNPPFVLSLNTWNYGNGPHSLMAVATDLTGNSAPSPLVSINVSNPPHYTLSTGTSVIENLGAPLLANTQERQAWFVLSNDVHLLLYYISDYGVYPLQICDVNVSQGTARLTNSGALGRPEIRGTVLYPNGKIYEGTGQANGVGYFFEYSPATGQTRRIAQTTGYAPVFSEIGDDGWIYIGEYPYGYVDRYNPNTDTFQSLGMVDTNATIGTYAYTLGADSRYLYVGIGESPWYLGIYDTQTSNRTLYWYSAGDTYSAVRHATNGYWYFQRQGPATGNAMAWYQLTNGVPVAVSAPTNLFVENAQRGNVVDGVLNGYLYGYAADLSGALPNSGTTPPNLATISYQRIGAGGAQSLVVSNFQLAPTGVARCFSWDSTHLLCFPAFYAPVYLWNINSSSTTILGYPVGCGNNYNLYDAVVGQGDAYFSGYTAVLLRYNPGLPWTLTSAGNCSTSNPHLTMQYGKHDYYCCRGADGQIYVAAEHERDSAGGELAWYDPATGTNSSDRADFVNDEPSDLKSALNGTKIIYASVYSNLFVFDVPTKSVERVINPLGTNTLDKILDVGSGVVFGAAGSNVFEVNIATGALIYSNQLPGKAFCESIRQQDRRMVLGPDGYVWMFRWYRDAQNFNRTSLYRINPADASYSAILTNVFYTYGENNLIFNGNDLYLYGRQNLYRVPGMLISSRPQPASDLKALAPN